MAKYLLCSDPSVISDYRRCAFKDRLRILRDLESGSGFYDTKAGKRLLASVHAKLKMENLTVNDFAAQKANRWKIQGKRFYDIFAEVFNEDLYASTYGMMSESIHGSWHESFDWDLVDHSDGTFTAYPFSHPADVRYISPMLRFTNEPYRLWLQRIDAYDTNVNNTLDWIDRVNKRIFQMFDKHYDGPLGAS